ncbi:MAG: DUF6580 family putative transport protein [Pseudobdellovibrionaceae bacterium]
MTKLNQRNMILAGLILAFALLRLLPIAPNFTPIGALALFAGAHFRNKTMAFVVPLAALFISDAFLGFHMLMPYVYGAFALTTVIGLLGQATFSRQNKTLKLLVVPLVGGTISSLLFFAITNFGVWQSGMLYPMTMDGLAQCFTSAVPFFRNTLASTWLYSFVLFGAMALLESRVTSFASAKS